MSASDLLQLSLAEAAAAIKAKRVSPVELTDAALLAADRLQPTLGSFIIRWKPAACSRVSGARRTTPSVSAPSPKPPSKKGSACSTGPPWSRASRAKEIRSTRRPSRSARASRRRPSAVNPARQAARSAGRFSSSMSASTRSTPRSSSHSVSPRATLPATPRPRAHGDTTQVIRADPSGVSGATLADPA